MRIVYSTTLLLLALTHTALGGALVDVSYKEKLAESLSCSSGTCSEYYDGTYTCKISLSLYPDVEKDFTEATRFSFTMGAQTYDFLLGDDPNYEPGDTSAKFTKVLPLLNQPTMVTVKASWKKGKFRSTLKGYTPVADSPIGASYLSTNPGNYDTTVDLGLVLDNPFLYLNTVDLSNTPVVAKVKTKEKSVPPIVYNLETVTVKGKQ